MFHLSSCSQIKLNLYRQNRKIIKCTTLSPEHLAFLILEGQVFQVYVGHLNINSICNKFEMLSMSVAQYVDILVLSETKLDSTFPSIQFLINGFSVPHTLDQNSKGGGILLYVRDKIIVLPLNRYSLPPHIEILFFELNLRNQKWLVCCSYNPHKNIIKEHLQVFTESIQFY